jgi:hypothetical protein
MLYVHTNRVIKAHDLNAMFLVGPGHGGPAIVAATYLEGTYSEVYPGIGKMRQAFATCSASSARQGASRRTCHLPRPAPSTKAESWDTC